MSSTSAAYELLDFGAGRKLERFSNWVLDRPCPAAANIKPTRKNWSETTAKYQADRAADGVWRTDAKDWANAEIDFPVQLSQELEFRMRLSPLPSGQIGVFYEQFANWQWIARQVARSRKPLKVLNLFAYTGGSTLAAAAAGAEVVHLDASKSMVSRARENATLSGFGNATIRWIVEDAVQFCGRELKRGNQYDGMILDPPSYGHGPKGQQWSIKRDLLPLLELCGQLTADSRAFVLCTCHSPGLGPAELSAYLADGIFGHCGQPGKGGTLYLQATDGRKLPSGVFARWPA